MSPRRRPQRLAPDAWPRHADYPDPDVLAAPIGHDEVTTPEALARGLRIAHAVLVEGKSVHAAAAEVSTEPEVALDLMAEVRRYLDGAIVAASMGV